MQGYKKVTPLYSRVLIKKLVPKAKSVGGVLLPENKLGPSNIGQVVETGQGKVLENGVQVSCYLKQGQYVLLPDYGGVKVPKTENNENLFIYQEDDILGVVEGDFERI